MPYTKLSGLVVKDFASDYRSSYLVQDAPRAHGSNSTSVPLKLDYDEALQTSLRTEGSFAWTLLQRKVSGLLAVAVLHMKRFQTFTIANQNFAKTSFLLPRTMSNI